MRMKRADMDILFKKNFSYCFSLIFPSLLIIFQECCYKKKSLKKK